MVVVACWIYASHLEQNRHGVGRCGVDKRDMFTEHVRAELCRSGAANHLTLVSSAKDWDGALQHVHGKVVGLALVRPLYSPSIVSVQSPTQRAVHDYWMKTRYSDRPILFVQLVQVVALFTPIYVRASVGNRGPRSTFVDISPFSCARLMATQTLDRDDPAEVLAVWAEMFNNGQAFTNARGELSTCMVMPVSHAVLCASEVWSSWGFPAFVGRGSNQSTKVMRALCQGLQLNDARAPADIDTTFNAAQFLEVADLLRMAMQPNPTFYQQERDRAVYYIGWLQATRDSLMSIGGKANMLAYKVDYLVRCVVAAGFLRSFGSFKEAMHCALDAICPSRDVAEYLKGLLVEKGSVPSSSSLDRHRLTVHIGFCRWMQSKCAEMLDSPGGMIRWATADGSPQGPYDWILQGATSMKVTDLVASFRLANQLCSFRNGGPRLEVAEEKDIVTKLDRVLRLVQGVPAGVGSGRSGLKHKFHAAAHSARITSPSWAAAAAVMNATMTWTGDLGTESGFARFRGDLRAMFGDWIVEQDNLDLGIIDGDADDPLDEFDIQPEIGGAVDVDVAAALPGLDFDIEPERGAGLGVAEAPSLDGAAAHPLNIRDPDLSGPPAAPYEIDCTHSLFLAGMLHIVHNLTEGMSGALTYFDTFVAQLKQVTRLLSKPWSKSRFLQTCGGGAVGAAFQGEFASFNSLVYEKRWGTVLAAVAALIPLREALCNLWSLRAFSLGTNVANDRDDDGNFQSVKADIADAAIKDPFFWAYANMLDRISEVLLAIAAWAEGCACHSGDPLLYGPTRHQRVRVFAAQTGGAAGTCPMKTRRAFELAAGGLWRLLRRFFQIVNTALLLDPLTAALSEEGRALILREFGNARRHIYFTFKVKCSFYQQLPWVLLGLAHYNVRKARACGRRALALVRAAGNVAHHWLVRVICIEPLGLEQLVRFVCGEDLSALPLLERMAARFKFAMVTERWVESLHAQNKKALDGVPHGGAVHVAFHGIQKPLRDMLRNGVVDDIEALVNCCQEARNPRGCLAVTGLMKHPTVKRLLDAKGGRTRELHLSDRSSVVRLLYHVDSATLYQDLPDPIQG
jgi:hypothetical protein